jgi:hypothetical protein
LATPADEDNWALRVDNKRRDVLIKLEPTAARALALAEAKTKREEEIKTLRTEKASLERDLTNARNTEIALNGSLTEWKLAAERITKSDWVHRLLPNAEPDITLSAVGTQIGPVVETLESQKKAADKRVEEILKREQDARNALDTERQKQREMLQQLEKKEGEKEALRLQMLQVQATVEQKEQQLALVVANQPIAAAAAGGGGAAAAKPVTRPPAASVQVVNELDPLGTYENITLPLRQSELVRIKNLKLPAYKADALKKQGVWQHNSNQGAKK